MSTTAQIVLTGICAIATLGASTDVLCPVGAGDIAHVPAHKVFLLVTDDYSVDLSNGSPLVVKSASNELGKNFKYVELTGTQISVENQTDSVLTTAPEVTAGQPAPLSEKEVESISWIPRMSRVWPFMLGQHHVVKNMHQGVDPELAFRMNSIHGRLACSWVGDGTWLFHPRSVMRSKLIQATAEEVTLQMALTPSPPKQQLKLSVSSLPAQSGGAQTSLGDLIITQTPNAPDPLTVMIANVPEEDLLPDGSAGPPCIPNLRDDHFRLYYELYHATPGHPILPFRRDCGTTAFPSAARVGGPNCPPVYDVDQ